MSRRYTAPHAPRGVLLLRANMCRILIGSCDPTPCSFHLFSEKKIQTFRKTQPTNMKLKKTVSKYRESALAGRMEQTAAGDDDDTSRTKSSGQRRSSLAELAEHMKEVEVRHAKLETEAMVAYDTELGRLEQELADLRERARRNPHLYYVALDKGGGQWMTIPSPDVHLLKGGTRIFSNRVDKMHADVPPYGNLEHYMLIMRIMIILWGGGLHYKVLHRRRVICITSCPCLSDADWCLQIRRRAPIHACRYHNLPTVVQPTGMVRRWLYGLTEHDKVDKQARLFWGKNAGPGYITTFIHFSTLFVSMYGSFNFIFVGTISRVSLSYTPRPTHAVGCTLQTVPVPMLLDATLRLRSDVVPMHMIVGC